MTGGKPLDVGSGAVAASFDASSAAWLSIGAPHMGVGFVELSGMPPFDERRRGDAAATRAWRRALGEVAHAFLLVEIDGAIPSLDMDATDSRTPAWAGDGLEVRAWAPANGTAVHQRWRVVATDVPRTVRVRLAGRLDRPALAEITEVDPPRPTGAVTRMDADGDAVRLAADPIGASAWASLTGTDSRWSADGAGLAIEAICPAPGEIELELSAGIGQDTSAAEVPAEPSASDPLTDRALAYVRGCTALRVAPGQRVILTDHRILPLSWTRDAYWQALALLATDTPADRGRVADHLRWLWQRCERPDGVWVRSHHADGRRKDLAFQADQQLYPLLELADHWRVTGDLPAGVAWPDLVPRAWAAAMAQVDRATGLIASHETASDDPVEAPFLAAAQVLLWYTAERLAELGAAHAIDIPPGALHETADAVRAAFLRGHAAGDAPWAYAIGPDGRRIQYHDANDLPVAFAPIWGFCRPDDPGWRATMRFAFGPSNPGWFAGRRSGLGSLHTPGPWPLGDVQALVAGLAAGDRDAADGALARLRELAFPDGMLPEAYEADGDARIRQWFAWPGAVLAAVRLLDADGRLEPMLRVARR